MTEREIDLLASGHTTCRHNGELFKRADCWEHGPAWKVLGEQFTTHSKFCKWCGPTSKQESFELEDLCAQGQMMFRRIVPANATNNPDDIPAEDEQYGDAPGDHAWGRR